MKRESKKDLNVNQNYCLLCSLEIGLRSSKIPTVIETHTFFLPPVPTFAQIETKSTEAAKTFCQKLQSTQGERKTPEGKRTRGWVGVCLRNEKKNENEINR